MNRAEKTQAIQDLNQNMASAASAVVLHYRGMTVAEITTLRRNARKEGVTLKVMKNTLARLAVKDTKFDGLKAYLKGPTALAYSNDEIAAAKTIVNFAKKNEKLVVIGGIVGENLLDEAGVKSLASLPSLNESRAQLLGLLMAPASRIASILQAPGGQVARVISAHANKGEGASEIAA